MSGDRPLSSASQSSLISYNSVEDAPTQEPLDPESLILGHDRPKVSTDSESPSSRAAAHRVHFGSDLRFEYGTPDTESDGDDAGSTTDRPFTHGSVDITDSPRTQPSPTSSPNEKLTEKDRGAVQQRPEQPEQRRVSTGPSTVPGASFFDRINSLRHRTKIKARKLATKLGRPLGDEDDDLQPTYHPALDDGLVRRPTSDSGNGDRPDEYERPEHDTLTSEAHRLVRDMTHDHCNRRVSHPPPFKPQQAIYPGSEVALDPRIPRDGGGAAGGGVLAQLLKLNAAMDGRRRSSASQSPSESQTPGSATPRKMKWYKKKGANLSTSTLVGGTGRGSGGGGGGGLPPTAASLSGASTPVSNDVLTAASKRRSKQGRGSHNMRLEDEIQVTLQIAQIIARQRYIMQLCKALMLFGAPTHRLEEYMQMTSRVLEVDSQYLYVPGCMIMSFDDPSTRTAEVKLVRVGQGIDLGRLADTHNIYKNVVHDVIGIEEAIQELEDIMAKKPRFNKWIIVLVYGLATAMVGPFAFNARPIDLPIIFFNGCLLGFMQHVLAPRSVLYSNVFEVSATVLTSFIARALGSIKTSVDGSRVNLFCFSAIAQSSIALILPGYTVLCSSLELQSHQIVAGSIRMVYAIIYSLFLGFGLTVGTTIYGLIDADATSATTCPRHGSFRNPYVQRFPFVVAFALCLMIVNQGKWRQTPMMVTIALAGYVTNYFVTRRLGTNSQVAQTVASFAIGVMGNLYSRLWHGHAATAILPGIFVLVPSGLAATGSLIAGVESADQIRSNVSTNSANRSNGDDITAARSNGMASQSLGYGMVQVAIAITVGLFVAALVVYPFGKRRTGLFSF
ncbi:hypothetical protein FE257_011504 [Aspergillus nanangensis]|uniref:DUF1212 domain membrane protein n=1 Tax=Aspergillus nanangensis TaxID=2582783 RepID=A0AAD4CH33_ASPNN|nr:hypothetical protein FE257_011504 [Aspergillus nanangensis]